MCRCSQENPEKMARIMTDGHNPALRKAHLSTVMLEDHLIDRQARCIECAYCVLALTDPCCLLLDSYYKGLGKPKPHKEEAEQNQEEEKGDAAAS